MWKWKSKTIVIALVIISILSIIIFQKRDVIFQEGNPIPLAVAITKVSLNGNEIVDWKKNRDNFYVVKKGDLEPYIKMMKKEGWEFAERIETSNTLIFQKENVTKSVSYKNYTRYYTIIYSY